MKRKKFNGLRDYLLEILFRDHKTCSSWNYLWYLVEIASQRDNDTMRLGLINNMMFSKIGFL
jgi:hypothetical protein